MNFNQIFTRWRLLFCLLLLVAGRLSAQPVLTLEEAVKIALQNNYEIKLAANNTEIAENNVSIGNAGFLPAANATFSDNNNINNIKQTRADGTVQEQNGVRNTNFGYGVGLSWTVFNGFGMFARYEQLKELRKRGEADFQFTVLTKVGDVISTYYDLVQQQQTLQAFDTVLSISRQRVDLAQIRFEIGKAARLEVLNAQVDFNTDTTNLLRQLELYNNTRVLLNEIMARDVQTEFVVSDTFMIDNSLLLANLQTMAAQHNPTLKAAIINRRIAELDLKQVRANRYPAVSLNTGYNFSQSQSPLGFARESTNRGFNYGVSASVNLFNGFNQRRNEQNAAILIENSELEFERINQNINSQLTRAYQTYQTNLSLVKLEENNQQIAKRNLDITMDKFELGSISTVEFRDAQVNYLNATIRYSNAQYQAKLAEIALREITGNIMLE